MEVINTMVTKTQAENSIEVALKGKYKTTNTRLFKGATVIDGETVDFSMYASNDIPTEVLEKSNFFVSLKDLKKADTPKQAKK